MDWIWGVTGRRSQDSLESSWLKYPGERRCEVGNVGWGRETACWSRVGMGNQPFHLGPLALTCQVGS